MADHMAGYMMYIWEKDKAQSSLYDYKQLQTLAFLHVATVATYFVWENFVVIENTTI